MTGYSFKTFDPATGTAQAFLPDYSEAAISLEFSDVGALTLKYPKTGRNFSSLDTDRIEVGVFYNGVEIDDGRFTMDSDSLDEVDTTGMTEFNGRSLLNMLDYCIVYPLFGSTAVPQTFTNKTPGEILRALFLQNSNRGGQMSIITWATFTNAADSNSVAWGTTIGSITYNVGTSYLDILRNMVDNGLIELKMIGRDLRIYAPDTNGVDRTTQNPPIVLREGRDLLEAPTTSTSEQVAGVALIEGDKGILAENNNTTVNAAWGRREVYMSQGGITDVITLAVLSQKELFRRASVRRQKTRKVNIKSSGWEPNVDYRVSDWIYSDTTGVSEKLRIRQLIIEIDNAGIKTASLVLNDKFLEQEILLARRVSGILGGATASGSVTVPKPVTDVGTDLTIPSQVTGLSFTSAAYQNSLGETKAQITATWTAVSTNTDSTVIDDFDHYDVQVKRNSTSDWGNEATTQTDTNTAYVSVPPNVVMDVRARAADSNGHKGAWSSTSTGTTASDTTAPPVPSTPTAAAYLGQLRIFWDGLGSVGEAMPGDFRYTEVHLSTTTGFTPSSSTLVDQLNAKGYSVQTSLTYGTPYYVKLISVDRSGNKSSASAQATATPASVTGLDIAALTIATSNMADLAISTAKIADAAIINAKIANLAVDDAKIGSMSVGKLTAGSLTADMTVSARIKTANTGARVEINSAGFQAYNASSVKTVDISASTGAATFTGTLKTDFSNSTTPHVEMTPANNTIWMTSNDGLGTSGNAGFMNAPLDGSNVPQIGVNTGIFTGYDGVSGRHRLFMKNVNGIELTTQNQGIGGQVGYGLFLNATDTSITRRNGAGVANIGYSMSMSETNFSVVRSTNTASDLVGGGLQMDAGSIYLYRWGSGGLNGGQYYADTTRTQISGVASGVTNAYLGINDNGLWDMFGKMYNNASVSNAAGDMIMCGSATGSLGTATTFNVAYGATCLSRPGVVYSYYGSSQETSRLSSFTTTGFTVVMGSSVGANFQYWAFRV